MGQLLRSEKMQLVQLYMQVEATHDTLDELGNLGLLQFRDVCILKNSHRASSESARARA